MHLKFDKFLKSSMVYDGPFWILFLLVKSTFETYWWNVTPGTKKYSQKAFCLSLKGCGIQGNRKNMYFWGSVDNRRLNIRLGLGTWYELYSITEKTCCMSKGNGCGSMHCGKYTYVKLGFLK